MKTLFKVVLRAVLLGSALLGTAACSSDATPQESVGDGGFPTSAFQMFTTAGGKLNVELRLSEQPPQAGLNEVQYLVTDATTGAPVDGLDVVIVPWMPAMGHGASVTPILQPPEGNGVYHFTNVSLFMAGEWQLRTKFSGQVTDSAAPTFSVP